MIVATLYNNDLDNPSVVEGNILLEGVTLETLLHGGFGQLSGSFAIPGARRYAHWYDWYNRRLNFRLVAWNQWGQQVFEGRLEDVNPMPGMGVDLVALGYWSSCFDQTFEDKTTYKTGTHTKDEIIKAILTKSCPQISSNQNRITAQTKNISPYEIELLHPGDIFSNILSMGDDTGAPLYFALWENRVPWLVARPTIADWVCSIDDLETPQVTPRSLRNFYTAIRAEFQAAGEQGSVNDDGTATGENANNLVTVTQTTKTWERGQWDNNFEMAITGGTGLEDPIQIRDIKETRVEPTVIDSRAVTSVYDTGTAGGSSVPSLLDINVASLEKHPGGITAGVLNTPAGFQVEMISGACAGQVRGIISNDSTGLHITPDWTNPNNPIFGVNLGDKFRIFHPNRIFRETGDWAADAYNNGHVVELIAGAGTNPPQRLKITDTVASATDMFSYLEVEPAVETAQTGPPFTDIGNFPTPPPEERLSRPEIPTYATTLYTDTPTAPATPYAAMAQSYAEIQQDARIAFAGKVTAITQNTLSQSTATWTVDQWKGYHVKIYEGAGQGQTIPIKSNTATVLTLAYTWEDMPTALISKFYIVAESEVEEQTDPDANQLLLSAPLTTPIDNTTTYEIRQKKAGGTIERTRTVSTGASYRKWGLIRELLLQLGTIQEGMAEGIVRAAARTYRDPSLETPTLTLKRVYHAKSGQEYPLNAMRAGQLLEVVDMPIAPAALRQFFIIKTSYQEANNSIQITPERPDRNLETLIASAQVRLP